MAKANSLISFAWSLPFLFGDYLTLVSWHTTLFPFRLLLFILAKWVTKTICLLIYAYINYIILTNLSAQYFNVRAVVSLD